MEPPKSDNPPPAEPKDEHELPEAIKAQLSEQPKDEPEAELPEHVVEQPLPQTEKLILPPKSNKKPMLLSVLALLLIAGAGATYYFLTKSSKNDQPSVSVSQTTVKKATVSPPASNLPGLQLASGKNYGNKYANGILPVGDNQYSAATPKIGTVYVCSGYANNLKASQGGAQTRGPWFVGTTQWNINKKLHVQGAVTWQASFSNKVSGNTRTIVTNDLPDHTTGVFPISASDPAYAYDRNPNSIKGQTFTYALSSAPTYASTPNCIGGQVGIMLTGVALFSAFDAGGRDAGAWEVQDSCNGHPQSDGIYHYHTLSSCIKDTSVKTVIGYALDGYPITGPQVAAGNILTTSDLDECHGLTSPVTLDGKTVTTYHYVMTQDFPYSVSCYRSTAIQPPGQNAAAQAPKHP